MKPRPSPLRLDRAPASRVLGVAAALVLNAFQSNLVFFFTPSQVAANEAPQGRAVPHRRHGRDRQPRARPRRPDRALSRHRHRARRFRSSTPASCPTCSRKAKASSRRARSAPTACSTRPKCSPSTTRTTCRPRRKAAHRRRRSKGTTMPSLHEHTEEPTMIPELGHFALILALLVALVQGTLPLRRRRARRRRA